MKVETVLVKVDAIVNAISAFAVATLPKAVFAAVSIGAAAVIATATVSETVKAIARAAF